MDRYKTAFDSLHKASNKAFVPFTLLGWPNTEKCFETIKAMIDSGATALELGIAFSDPVADGPIIQAAAFEVLDAGFSVTDAFALLARVRKYNATIPIGLLVYYNVVLARGIDKFYSDAAKAGIDSVLIADLSIDDADEVVTIATKHSIQQVFIVSPLTDEPRLKRIASLAGGYIYIVSRLGITGTEERHDVGIEALLQRTKVASDLPLCVGFGVSSPDNARNMFSAGSDGVITGSKIIELIRTDEAPDYPRLREFVTAMVSASKVATTLG